MEINKQLFEDVLSGKLKGVFVLRNNDNIKSTLLERDFSSIYPYKFKFLCILYTNTGLADRLNSDNCNYDVVDFIPDTNMKEDELTIEIPNGKIAHVEYIGNKINVTFEDKKLVKL